jgi:replicative DNA helicase
LGGENTVSKCISHGITKDSFYVPANQEVFDHLVALCSRGIPPTLEVLIEEFRHAGQLEAIGGVPYLIALSSRVPTSAEEPYYIAKVKELFHLRELIKLSLAIHEKAYEYEGTIAEAFSPYLEQFAAIQAGGGDVAYRKTPVIVKEAEAWAMAQMKGQPSPTRQIFTGLPSFDRYATPIESHEYVLVGARTARGKTSLMTQVAGHNLYRGVRTVYFTLETSDRAIIQKLASQQSRVNLKRFAEEPADKQQAYFEALKEVEKMPLLVFSRDLTLSAIESRCRFLKNSFHPELVILDYLGLIGIDSGGSIYERTSMVSKAMIPLQKLLDCTLMVGCQFNRAAEAQPGQQHEHQPTLAALRDAGVLEEDAARVIALHRPEKDKAGQKQGLDRTMFEMQLLQLKMRDGPVCGVEVHFAAPYTFFYEPAKTP